VRSLIVLGVVLLSPLCAEAPSEDGSAPLPFPSALTHPVLADAGPPSNVHGSASSAAGARPPAASSLSGPPVTDARQPAAPGGSSRSAADARPPAPVDERALATLADAEPALVLQQRLRAYVPEPTAVALEDHLRRTATALHARLRRVEACDADDVTLQLTRHVAANLVEKHRAGFPLDAERLRRQVIEAEAFKLETFVATGVYPKRYFGYLDEQWDTADFERRLKVAARKAAAACNRWLENAHAPFRVTEQELVVTFLAEGGAVLLRERQAELESIHPVLGIGLDDIARGFVDLAPLVRLLDEEVGTRLEGVVAWRGGAPVLTRTFRFEEAIAGTAVMWVWEKQLAERKLVAKGRASLGGRPLDEQFVITSLVYNSGLLFDEKTIARVRALDTGGSLYALSEASKAKRWALPVLPPARGLRWLLGGSEYPHQPTSWSALYHVLQRAGAAQGLSRFTDAFDDRGRLR
jgi:hypothetical protein